MLNITSENIILNLVSALVNMKYKKLGNIVSFSCLYQNPNKFALIVSLIASVISIVSLIALLIYFFNCNVKLIVSLFPMLFQYLAISTVRL
jgi:hypothetical protein